VAGGPVLVVDDDPVAVATLAEVLASEGYQVDTARDGADALAHLAERVPHVLLLDKQMPGLDGGAVAQFVHQQGLPVRIIAVTGARDASAWAREIQADGVVPKPFDLYQLLAEVARVCAA
jgi:two-component system, OmpR family, response regulator MprA